MNIKEKFLLLTILSIISVVSAAGDDDDDYGSIFDNLSPSRASKSWDDPNCDEDQKCVPYYLCKEDGIINTDGKFLLNPRNEGIGKPIPGCTALSMCCKLADYINGTGKVTPASLCKKVVPPKKCGFRNLKGLGGTAGTVTDASNPDKKDVVYSHYAEFPWMVGIVERFGNLDTMMAGGSLIHPRIVLTSAHNTAKSAISNLIVRGGEWDAGTENEMCKHEERAVEDVVRHESFNADANNFQNDIALVLLKKPFEMTAFINTICLPPPNFNFDRKSCVSSGWGKTQFIPEAQMQLVLKKIVLPVVPHDECERMFRKTLLGVDFKLHENFLCAGGEEGIDACTGDGGAAIACEIRGTGHYYQAGIVAAGIQCGKKDIPGLYTDVAKNREWIDQKIVSFGIDAADYHNY